tara:strand:+ start:232 stop:444 length:213 start_codon:yes stop_codon:yes gene_type:complete
LSGRKWPLKFLHNIIEVDDEEDDDDDRRRLRRHERCRRSGAPQQGPQTGVAAGNEHAMLGIVSQFVDSLA